MYLLVCRVTATIRPRFPKRDAENYDSVRSGENVFLVEGTDLFVYLCFRRKIGRCWLALHSSAVMAVI